jgi:hypothetical protein
VTFDGAHFSVDKTVDQPADGVLGAELKSEIGFNLHADVKFWREEKDIPATRDRVKLLKKEAAQLVRKIEEQKLERLELNSIKSKEQMEAYELKAAKQPKLLCDTVLQRLNVQIDYEIAGPETSHKRAHEAAATDHDALLGLVRLLRLLKQAGQIDEEEMDTGSLATIDELLLFYQTIEVHQEKARCTPTLLSFLGDAHAQTRRSEVFREDCPPKRPLVHLDTLRHQVTLLQSGVSVLTPVAFSAVGVATRTAIDNQAATAVALLTFWAFYGANWLVSPLLLVGVFMLVQGMIAEFSRVTESVHQDLRQGLDTLRHDVHIMSGEGTLLKADVLGRVDVYIEKMLTNPHTYAMTSPLMKLLPEGLGKMMPWK